MRLPASASLAFLLFAVAAPVAGGGEAERAEAAATRAEAAAARTEAAATRTEEAVAHLERVLEKFEERARARRAAPAASR